MCTIDLQHPSNVLFIELHVLKLHDLIELRTAMIMYKAYTGCLPVNLQTMFRMSSQNIHNTRNSSNVRQVFARTTKLELCLGWKGQLIRCVARGREGGREGGEGRGGEGGDGGRGGMNIIHIIMMAPYIHTNNE